MAPAKATVVRMDEKKLQVLDAELEAKASDALLPLMKLRWEQTIGGGGYSFSEYGRIVDRKPDAIRRAANGYAITTTPGVVMRAIDAYAIGADSEPERDAIVATAEAVDSPISEVRRARRPDLKAGKQAAREVIDEGGSAEEAREAAKAAADNARTDLSDKRERLREQEEKRRSERSFFLWSEIEAEALKARRSIANMVPLVQEGQLTDDMREFLEDDLAKIKDAVRFVELALADTLEVDWDHEFKRLTAKEERP
jgi:hypothetical protein